jgi:hypothetical protein
VELAGRHETEISIHCGGLGLVMLKNTKGSDGEHISEHL